MEGNSVYYNRHRSSVSYSSSSSSGGGGGGTNNSKCEKTSKTKENHIRQKYNYDEPRGGEKYSKYSRKDAAWKKRYESNGTTGLNKTQDYERGSGSSGSTGHGKMTKRFDDTMFPFDREAIGYEPPEATNDWYKNNARYLSNFGSNQYDTPSPDYDYYESFCAKSTNSAPRKSSTSDVRLFKELTRISYKQQQDEQRAKQSSTTTTSMMTSSQAPHYPSKLSKYDNTPSPSTSPKQLTCMTKYEQNHISDPDAFSPLPAKQNNETNNSATTTTANTSSNANSNNDKNCCINNTKTAANTSENSVSKFEQIASMFDQIPPKPSDAFRKPSFGAAADLVHTSSSALATTTPPQSASDHQSTGYGTVSSPLPDFRVDFFAESSTNEKTAQKRHSFVDSGAAMTTTHRPSSASQHDTQAINVTSNPMDESNGCASSTQQLPRATIVVQQVMCDDYYFECDFTFRNSIEFIDYVLFCFFFAY